MEQRERHYEQLIRNIDAIKSDKERKAKTLANRKLRDGLNSRIAMALEIIK